tara:strand:- start:18792 stop:20360 length:1569 start_codon:yes stop_codon:yes gene_type:complete
MKMEKLITIVKACAFLLIGTKLPAQTGDTSIGQNTNICVIVDRGKNQQINEPSIAINPKSPNEIVIGANVNKLYYSKNFGETWVYKQAKSSLGVYGDPVLHFNSNGKLFFAHLSKTPEKKWGAFFDRIVFQRSLKTIDSLHDGIGIGFNKNKMQDKPWISSMQPNKTCLSWTEFDQYNSSNPLHKSRIKFAISLDSGKTFSDAIHISDTTGDCLDSDHTLEGATTAFNSNGTIYCAWAGHHKIYLDSSTNNGKTWNRDKIIAPQKSGWDLDLRQFPRSNALPFLMINQSKSTYGQRMFLLFADNIYGDMDIFILYSDNFGQSWSTPIRVNQDLKSNGSDQFLPNMAIDPITGHLYVIYYDRRHSSTNTFVAAYLSYSLDGGKSFKDIQIGKNFAPPGKNYFFGDYLDVDAYNGIIHPVWTEHHTTHDEILTSTLFHDQLKNIYPIPTEFQYFISKKELVLFHPTNNFSYKVIVKDKNKILFRKSYRGKDKNEYFLSLEETHQPKLKIKMTNNSSSRTYRLLP